MTKKPGWIDVGAIEAEENLLIDAQHRIQGLINQKGFTRAQVAERAGMSKAQLSQIMGPNANPTLKTIARIFHALGERVSLEQPAQYELAVAKRAETQSGTKWESHSPRDAAVVRLEPPV